MGVLTLCKVLFTATSSPKPVPEQIFPSCCKLGAEPGTFAASVAHLEQSTREANRAEGFCVDLFGYIDFLQGQAYQVAFLALVSFGSSQQEQN